MVELTQEQKEIKVIQTVIAQREQYRMCRDLYDKLIEQWNGKHDGKWCLITALKTSEFKLFQSEWELHIYYATVKPIGTLSLIINEVGAEIRES